MFFNFSFIAFFLFSGVNSEIFCNNPHIDSALSIDNQIYLFRGSNYWILNPANRSVTQNSFPINETFNAQHRIEHFRIEMHRILALFSTVKFNDQGEIDSSQSIFYLIEGNNYFFLHAFKSGNERYFIPLNSKDNISIPSNWKYFGGTLKECCSDWFPENIDSIIRVNNYLLVFHGSQARYVELNPNSEMTKEWPKGQVIEFPFDGSLKNVSKIDEIFEFTSSDDIVITAGLQFCRFNRTQIDINPKFTNTLNISCKWNETKYLFYCEKPIEPLSTEYTTITEDYASNSSEDRSSTTESTTISTESSEDTKSDTLITVLIVVGFSVLVILIVGSIITFAIFRSEFRGTGHGKKSPMLENNSEDTVSIASVVTVDSRTGKSIK